MKRSIWEVLRFDEPETEFELLETEEGNPGFFGGWPDSEQSKQQPPSPPATSSVDENEQRLKKEFFSISIGRIVQVIYAWRHHSRACRLYQPAWQAPNRSTIFILRQGMHPLYDGCGENRAQYAF
jgi:hypothetical protein